MVTFVSWGRGPKFDEELLKLDARGQSFSQIAAALGVTRSVVAGRLKRIRAKAPQAVRKREPGKNPNGVKQDSKKRAPPYTHKPRPQARAPNRNSIAIRPLNAVNMTKSELREMLHQAVKNTK